MKKILSSIALIILIATLCVAISSCASSTSAENPIDFDKKYVKGDTYYVFNADGTGYSNYYYKYEGSTNPQNNYTRSGVVSFEWKGASDGAIYLFRTGETLNQDHTEGETLPLISSPIYFGDDFFAYTSGSGGYISTTRYIVENSKLAKAVETEKK